MASMLGEGVSEQESVECPYCPCTMPKSDLKKHYKVCELACICPTCKEVMSVSKVDSHFHPPTNPSAGRQKTSSKKQTSVMPRPIQMQTLPPPISDQPTVDCHFCGENVARSKIKHHLERCKNASQCPICATYMSKEDYRDHSQACAYSQSLARQNTEPWPAHQEIIYSDGSSYTEPEEQAEVGNYDEGVGNYGEEVDNSEELERQLPKLSLQDSAYFGPNNYEVAYI